ncbi:MAG: hypothetical protein QM709_00625 [Spongiibacteraceae bacterium]
MANWNYRVIRKSCQRTGTVTYQVHEVYYAEDGRIDCWTQQPVEPLGTSEAQLRNDVHAFLAAFRQPVLEEKFVLGQLQLVEEKIERTQEEDLERDYKSRVSRASGYLFQMLGNHLLLKQDSHLRKAYDAVDQALTKLSDSLERPVMKKKIG